MPLNVFQGFGSLAALKAKEQTIQCKSVFLKEWEFRRHYLYFFAFNPSTNLVKTIKPFCVVRIIPSFNSRGRLN